MKERVLFIMTCFLVLSSKGFAGGVTVGNGQGKVLVGLSLKNDFRTEMDLTHEAQLIIDSIQRDQYQRVKKMQADGKCKLSYSQVKSLNIESFLPIINGHLSLEREYVGYLQVELKECKQINKIEADEPFGGADFWEL